MTRWITRAGTVCLALLFVASCGSRNAVRLDGSTDDDGMTSDGPIVQQDGPPGTDGNPPQPDQFVYQDAPVFDYLITPPDTGVPDAPVVPPDQSVPLDTGPQPDMPTIPPDTCKNAQLLTLSGGKTTVKSNTYTFKNEYGTAINCNNTGTIMSGPQLYYKVALKANQAYLFTLESGYNYGRFYIFDGCGIASINASCGSGGTTGAVSGQANKNQTETLQFKPGKAGTYYVAVDATNPSYGGSFTLTIEEYTPPANSTCAKAKLLTIPPGGEVTVTGTTVGATNQFGTQITCKSSYTMDGQQVYYKAAMTAGTTYRISWDVNVTYSRVYIFGTTCTAAAINNDCGSGGTSGIFSGPTSSSYTNSRTFTPSKTGTYTIAMDNAQAANAGSFKLTIGELPTNDSCAKAKTVSLSGGKATISSSTVGLNNEFGKSIDCGGSSDFDAPQLYYALSLTAGKMYKFTLQPAFYARMYLFNSVCTASSINASCGSNGGSGDYTTSTVSPGNSGSFVFKAPSTGTYKLAIDGPYPSGSTSAGSFTATVAEYTPPQNSTCAKAQALTLSGGQVTVTGDTTSMPNQWGNNINCGYYSGAFDGPQLYYKLPMTGGTSYEITFKPSYNGARFYVATNTCTVSAINASCGSNGASGMYASAGSSGTTAVFTPNKTGTYLIAAESQHPSYYGTFTLTVKKYTPPQNAKCSGAQLVKLASGATTTVTGNTENIPNEFGTAINCGSYSTYDILLGSQLYYKVALTAGTSYTFTFTPNYSYGHLYLFTDTCNYATINTDCGSSGSSGFKTPNTGNGSPKSVTFKPTKSGIYKFAVDADRTYSSAAGQFKVEIK